MSNAKRTRRTNKLLAERVSSFHTVSSLRANQLADGYVPTVHDREVAQLLVNEGIKVYCPKGAALVADLTLDGVIFAAIRDGGGEFTARDIAEALDTTSAGIAYSLQATADAEFWALAKRVAAHASCRFSVHDLAMSREHLLITELLKGFVRAGIVQRWTVREIETRRRCNGNGPDTMVTKETVYAI